MIEFNNHSNYIGETIKIRFSFYSEDGYEEWWYINGVSVIGVKPAKEEYSIENLPSKTVIIGGEAFDIAYLNKNAQAQRKLISGYNSREEVYIKLNNGKIVNIKGAEQKLDVLPKKLTYYDEGGNKTVYVK